MTTKTIPAHGERARYLRGCRCTKCRAVHSRYCKQYALDRHRHGRRRVSAAPATEHVQNLLAAGCTLSGIVDYVNAYHSTVVELAAGTVEQLLPETAHSILSFRPGPNHPAFGHWTDATGTVRRLQALAVLGHPNYTIAEALEVAGSTLRKIAAGERARVSKATAAAVASLYAQWMTRPGPSNATRRRAHANNWHGPLAWDDIDNPDEQPDTADSDTAPRYLALAEDGEWLERTQGYTREHAAARLGVTRDNLQASISRARKKQQHNHNDLEVAA